MLFKANFRSHDDLLVKYHKNGLDKYGYTVSQIYHRNFGRIMATKLLYEFVGMRNILEIIGWKELTVVFFYELSYHNYISISLLCSGRKQLPTSGAYEI